MHGETSRQRRRFFAPEVVQTSAMDCGPAALKCLLEGFGVPVSYGRLREACQHLEKVRHCGPSTITQRLTALRAWAGFVGTNGPEHLEWSRQIKTVHLNRYGQPLTRFGIQILVGPHTKRAALQAPTIGHKRVSPHTIRHATAMGLLQSGVDLNTIRIWLGHGSLQTTHIYAESDLKMKAEALDRCEAPLLRPGRKPSAEKGLMEVLSKI